MCPRQPTHTDTEGDRETEGEGVCVYLELELQLGQDRQQQVAVYVVQLQDEVKDVFRQVAHGRLAQHQHLVEELQGGRARDREVCERDV